VKRLITSDGYARAKAISGVLFIIFGFVVISESIMRIPTAGFKVFPLGAFGVVIAALGIVRIRAYVMRTRL